jgi:MoCo/4Fe-4S cofactor protein with predicted Tat translocation signal
MADENAAPFSANNLGRPGDAKGRDYWRSLEEWSGDPAFQEALQREFPQAAVVWEEPISRRDLLKLTGATLALAGLIACRRHPLEKIVPYNKAPEDIVPGEPLFFATALTLDGAARGALVESHTGRPTKIEGNPHHPESLGATDIFMQASVLSLYDPDRSQVVLKDGQLSLWEAFAASLQAALKGEEPSRGRGLRILTETVISPTLAAQIRAVLQAFPEARWHQYEPLGRNQARAGARLAFGRPLNAVYRMDRADRILSLGADFLNRGPGHLRYAREFINGRRAAAGAKSMNRLYVAESTPTVTGSMADHRLVLAPSRWESLARELARRLGLASVAPGARPLETHERRWIAAAAEDLKAHPGRGLILAGEEAPAWVHALAHVLNHRLGNAGKTLYYTRPVEEESVDSVDSLGDLARDMAAGRVNALIMAGGNPAYTAPADLRFAELLPRIPFTAHFSLYHDETSELCHWHVPEAHALEMWSDARAFDGTASIVQPLIEPLYGGRSVHELLAVMTPEPRVSDLDVVRGQWRDQSGPGGFEAFWRKSLHDGVVAGTAFPAERVSPRTDFLGRAPSPAAAESLEVLFQPDPTVWDGRFANNGWLQELPKPLFHFTWDNAVLVSPGTAQRLQLATGDKVVVEAGGRRVEGPVWVAPGQADDVLTLPLGYGRERAGRLGTGLGFNAYRLRGSQAAWSTTGVRLQKTGERYPFASTQQHHDMEGRDLVRELTIQEYRQDPAAHAVPKPPPHEELYAPPKSTEENAWGMVIDINACIGCNACVLGCQSENNIPIVGKDQVLRGREMHWIRIDTYYRGRPQNPGMVHQPVPCMHCENAPCEPVCPVAATTHSPEGLNEMTYNRCVGTRYCSNNCPYKVRRFNFYQYADTKTETLKMQRNPDVTVRSRGVMEKCTYCVQRINAARITAKQEGRSIRDGEVVTACQAACPTRAIMFGNINDKNSAVSKLRAQPLHYGLLTELNTRPRTTYSARLRNPNPALEAL